MININNVVLVGRITKDPELRKTQSNTSVVSFTVAVNRPFKPQGQQQADADFISCIAWRQSADYLTSYCRKGDMVSVEGRIQTRNFDGQYGKVYVTEVVADHVQIINKEQRQTTQENPSYQTQNQTQYPPFQPQSQVQPQAQYPAQSQSYAEQQPLTGDDGRNMFGGKVNPGPSLDISSDDLPFY